MSSGLRQRVITAICIGIPILFLVFYSDTTRVSFLLLVGVLASHEYMKLFYPKLIKSPSGLISFLISVGLLFYSTQQLDIFFIPLLAVSIFSSVVLLYDLFYNESSIQEKMPALWNILYVVLPLVLIINLNHESTFSMILISTLLMIWISD
ncbi:MAG: phosphatidate cytidylyltransferase, partial [Saprospiraceae bacterium]